MARETFPVALDLMFGHEGDYVNANRDRGGATKPSRSKRAHLSSGNVTRHPQPTNKRGPSLRQAPGPQCRSLFQGTCGALAISASHHAINRIKRPAQLEGRVCAGL